MLTLTHRSNAHLYAPPPPQNPPPPPGYGYPPPYPYMPPPPKPSSPFVWIAIVMGVLLIAAAAIGGVVLLSQEDEGGSGSNERGASRDTFSLNDGSANDSASGNNFSSGGGDENAAINAMLTYHIQMSNDEDIPGYMSTIHRDSPLYSQTSSSLATIFSTYDLRYQFDNIRIEGVSGADATVRLDLTTTKISGPDFRDNRIDITFYLKKDGGQWKIYNQSINDVEYLN